MEILNHISDVNKFISNQNIILVPTMGALHNGHISLIETAKKYKTENSKIVATILVNQLQFDSKDDFLKYPKDNKKDLELLSKIGVEAVFLADPDEIFPSDFDTNIISSKSLSNCLCGKYRKSHFDGVVTVVAKLFNITKPKIAIFGEKDYQQFIVISKLAIDLNFSISIYKSKTIREESGLALSSRNQQLSKDEKEIAANLYRLLLKAKDQYNTKDQSVAKICQDSIQKLLSSGFTKVDYFEFRSESNLKLVDNFDDKSARVFVAATINKVRLIDNLKV